MTNRGSNKNILIITFLIMGLYLVHLLFLNAPLLGVVNILLVALTWYFGRQLLIYKKIDDKKWSIFSLFFLLSVFFLIGGINETLKKIGIEHSLKSFKLFGELTLLMGGIIVCIYRKNLNNFFNLRSNWLVHILIILLSLISTIVILKSFKGHRISLLFSNNDLCSLADFSFVLFSIFGWAVFMFTGILLRNTTNNVYYAIILISLVLAGFVPLPFGSWVLLFYFCILATVSVFSNNYLYILIGGFLLNISELFFLCNGI